MIKYKILPFLLGLLVNQNIVWIIKGNTTYIYIDAIFAIIICIIKFFGKQKKITIPPLVKYIKSYYFITIFASLIGLIIFSDTKYYLSPIYGAIIFTVSFSILLATILLQHEIKYMLKGFYCGFILNLLYSILCYFLFKFNIEWRVIQYFSTGEESPFALYNNLYYRAQGFFMECSFYIAYLSIGLPIILYLTKYNYIKFFLIISCFLLSAISFTGNIIFIILSLFLYFILIERKLVTRANVIKAIFSISIIVILFAPQISSSLQEMNFSELFIESIEDLNINNEDNISNVTRMYGITNALSLIATTPLGVGAGCSAPLLDLNFASQYGAISTYSFPIRILLESGWIGFLLYLIGIISIVKNLFKLKNLWSKTLGISLLLCILVQTANGIGWFGFILFILGICTITINKQTKFV